MTVAMHLLPPNAAPMEKALSLAGGTRVEGVPIEIDRPWSVDDCRTEHLHILAWSLSIDRWHADWSEEKKRFEIARSFEMHRQKGTRASLDHLFVDFDEPGGYLETEDGQMLTGASNEPLAALDRQMIGITEWWQATPVGAPHTFDVDIPLFGQAEERSTARYATALWEDITRLKPARSHFALLQRINGDAAIGMSGAGRAMRLERNMADAIYPTPIWDFYLQTEYGEPVEGGEGTMLEHD